MTEIGLTQSFPTCRPWQEFKGAMADWPSRSFFFFQLIIFVINLVLINEAKVFSSSAFYYEKVENSWREEWSEKGWEPLV